MTTAQVEQTLHPILIAFIVDLDDPKWLELSIQLNTSLWGGIFNQLIGIHSTAELGQINIEQQLPGFDPDYVVIAATCPIDVAFDDERVLKIDDIFSARFSWIPQIGIPIFQVLDAAYQKEFRYKLRHEVEECSTVFPDILEPPLKLFGQAIFGAGPNIENYANEFAITSKLPHLFEGEERIVHASNYWSTAGGHIPYPIDFTQQFLMQSKLGNTDNILFLMDGRNQPDLIEFWNLRAQGIAIVPIPIQWSTEISQEIRDRNACGKVISDRLYQGKFAVVAAQSVRDHDIEDFCTNIEQPKMEVRRKFTPRYPLTRIWNSSKTISVQMPDDNTLEFDLLGPPFLDGKRMHRQFPAFANRLVLNVNLNGYEGKLVVLPGITKLRYIFKTMGQPLVSKQDGLYTYAESNDRRLRMTLPSSTELCKKWLSQNKLVTELSGAGRHADYMYRAVGSLIEFGWLLDEDLLRQFDKMAHGLEERELEGAQPVSKKLRYDVGSGNLTGLLKKINETEKQAHTQLKWLCEHGILQLGVVINCPVCAHGNWIRFDSINTDIECQRCLTKFPFPAHEPPVRPWSYRTKGIFSLPGFADGSYCVLASLRFLTMQLHGAATWVPGVEMRLQNSRNKTEADIVIWWQKKFVNDSKTELVFAECKTFDKFSSKEFDRIIELSQQFPKALFALCTLRKTLDSDEKEALQTMIRDAVADDRQHLNLLILTGHELLSTSGPPLCWEGLPADLSEQTKMANLYELNNFAAASRILHLDSPGWLTYQQVQEAAYFKWENEGKPEGKHIEHWLSAAKALDAMCAKFDWSV